MTAVFKKYKVLEHKIILGRVFRFIGRKAIVDLGDYEVSERAMAGIPVLSGEELVGEVRQQIKDLLAEYKRAEEAKYEEQKAEVERRERELLHQLRISGSAVGEINLETSETWKGFSRELYSQFDQRLQQLKEQLLKNVA